MISPILRLLGAVAGAGCAVLLWFLGNSLSQPVMQGQLLHLDRTRYAVMAFLLIPALVLAVVALFWVPPRINGQGPLAEGRRLRLLLVLIFLGAFLLGIAR